MAGIKTRPDGPCPARIMIVGEAPGNEEEIRGVPFVGTSGTELTRMLHESGILRTECFLTNVCKYRPPENKIENFFLDKQQKKPNELIIEGVKELQEEIARCQPKLIIALGNTALWALTGNRGITKWRGSMLTHGDAMLMPTYHPALILREWGWRAIAVHDLRRAADALKNGSWPERKNSYIVRPSFEQTMDTLGGLLQRAASDKLKLASDIETRLSHIACHGIAWSETEAICIPYMCVERPAGYWTIDEETAIVKREKELLNHPNVELSGQNYSYDAQYKARRRGYKPRLRDDTMVMQNVAWPGLPKGLDFLSSMYRKRHVYWKDEGKLWDPKMPEERLWGYNCDDACATYEVRDTLEEILRASGLWDLYRFQMLVWEVSFEMMLRGIRIDQLSRGRIAGEMISAINDRERSLNYIAGHELNVRSPKQMHQFFYEELGRRIIKDRKTRKPTANDDAMQAWANEEPLLRPIIQIIADIRSLGTVKANVIEAELDLDGRIRSSFGITAETFRWTSSENAFGGGGNLQNWTKGDEDKEASALRPGQAMIPNVRKLAVPDLGKDIASIDLTGADAQTVAWESDDGDLKRVFRENKMKIHAYNAMQVWPDRCKTGMEQPYYDYIRTGVHLVNYGGQAPTLAAALGTSREQAQWFINYWFRLHPGILAWQERVQDSLNRTRSIRNAFGYRRFYFDRVSEILPEALAWIGQSTTACVTNRALVRMRAYRRYLEVGKEQCIAELQPYFADYLQVIEWSKVLYDHQCELLSQVHDEIVFQYPSFYRHKVLSAVNPLVHIQVPYDDPLVIPWGLKTSSASWGQCEKFAWPAQ